MTLPIRESTLAFPVRVNRPRDDTSRHRSATRLLADCSPCRTRAGSDHQQGALIGPFRARAIFASAGTADEVLIPAVRNGSLSHGPSSTAIPSVRRLESIQ